MKITVEFDTDVLAAMAKVDAAEADSWAADHFDSFVTAATGWGAEYLGSLGLAASKDPTPASSVPDSSTAPAADETPPATTPAPPPASSGSQAVAPAP